MKSRPFTFEEAVEFFVNKGHGIRKIYLRDPSTGKLDFACEVQRVEIGPTPNNIFLYLHPLGDRPSRRISIEEAFERYQFFNKGNPVGITEPLRYKIQNRYQDSGWEDIGESEDSLQEAVIKAARYSLDSIRYGMTRVIDTEAKFGADVIVTFPAGGRV